MAEQTPTGAKAPATLEVAAAPKPVHLTIDGIPVEVPPGTNLIEAARAAGVEIPYYCYHPRLSISANCRMCLVETSAAPKLLPGCQTPATEGLQVKTGTARVKDAQRATLELLLLNHPVDCSICDQAGECKLQDYYMKYDFKPSRLDGAKVLKGKRKELGPLVVLDQERCILCSRCVRFMNEIAREPQLGIFGRGSSERIDTFPGQPLDSNYAGNTVDLCPVGALLSRDCRFKARAFFLSTAPSVCTGCSRGCSTFLDHFDGKTYRYRPRENPKVNDEWMCDLGRISYKYLDHERILEARADGKAASAKDALRAAADALRPYIGSPKLGFAVSPLASVEDLLAALSLAKDGLNLDRVFVTGRASGKADHLLLREDRNPNRKAIEWIATSLGMKVEPFDALASELESRKLEALFALGGELPATDARITALLEPLELLVAQAFNHGPVAKEADVLLPASPHSESDGSFVNFEGVVQRFVSAYPPRGESRPHWKWAGELLSLLAGAAPWTSAREVFRTRSPFVPELSSFPWDRAPAFRMGARGIVALPAAADGRPAGYRERSTP